MSVWKKLKDASSTQGQVPFISKTGVTVDKLLRIGAGESREGTPFFKLELEVVEVVNEIALPSKVVLFNESAKRDKQVPEGVHQPGEKVCFYVAIKPPFIENKLNNVRNACEALFDALEVDYEDWDEDQWEAVVMGLPEVKKGKKDSHAEMRAWLNEEIGDDGGISGGDGMMLADTMLIRSSEARINKDKSGAYIVSTFAPADGADDSEEDDSE